MDIDVEQRFSQHPMGPGKQELSNDLRQAYKVLGTILAEHVPDSRERSLAATALEESMFWANAAIARNELA